jgi:tRNA pseudouridine38-40 synthase
MPRYKITIEYDGTNYCGWQIQKNHPTIQEKIENSISNIIGKKIPIIGSGRTDAGVHAIGQVAHFDLEKNFDIFKLQMAINHFLKQEEISIIKTEISPDNFHARFDASERIYQYKILNRRSHPAIDKNKFYHIAHDIDIDLMQKTANYLVGKHDFSSFRDAECQAKTPIRIINYIKFNKIGDIIIIEISGASFLHHMIRNIVGTLIYFSKKNLLAEKIQDILAKKKRSESGPNVSAHGLYFYQVNYN